MRKRRVTTEAERALWHTVIRDVRPLDPSDAPPLPPPAAPVTPPSADIVIPPVQKVTASRPGPVDRPTIERMRQGRIEIEARIDLHGMDQRAAFAALLGFVDMSIRLGRRAVLVITGKGAVSQGGGVLRRNAPQWLMASHFGPRILAIASAHLRHGGDGAFYVLLRRAR